ncbi:unnamed protein product [Blepharisma stoltei]|uniref:Peptidase S59 domain-containing protein n=1 Tax=Blepharisma stoltei TaxID=1481888 RepID=A0AAU9J5Q0_9CILI|nr:unnamed protein product [Blepharisma stoltei]
MVKLSRMTAEELKSEKNFTIENKFEKIVFDGETNVTSLNLDEIVKIDSRGVRIKHNSRYVKLKKGSTGQQQFIYTILLLISRKPYKKFRVI